MGGGGGGKREERRQEMLTKTGGRKGRGSEKESLFYSKILHVKEANLKRPSVINRE
jgi:hypothetical protein